MKNNETKPQTKLSPEDFDKLRKEEKEEVPADNSSIEASIQVLSKNNEQVNDNISLLSDGIGKLLENAKTQNDKYSSMEVTLKNMDKRLKDSEEELDNLKNSQKASLQADQVQAKTEDQLLKERCDELYKMAAKDGLINVGGTQWQN